MSPDLGSSRWKTGSPSVLWVPRPRRPEVHVTRHAKSRPARLTRPQSTPPGMLPPQAITTRSSPRNFLKLVLESVRELFSAFLQVGLRRPVIPIGSGVAETDPCRVEATRMIPCLGPPISFRSRENLVSVEPEPILCFLIEGLDDSRPRNPQLERRSVPRRSTIRCHPAGLLGIWGLVVGSGMLVLGDYASRPGDAGSAPRPMAVGEPDPPRWSRTDAPDLPASPLPVLASEPGGTGVPVEPCRRSGRGPGGAAPARPWPRARGLVGHRGRPCRSAPTDDPARPGRRGSPTVRDRHVRACPALRSRRPAALQRGNHAGARPPGGQSTAGMRSSTGSWARTGAAPKPRSSAVRSRRHDRSEPGASTMSMPEASEDGRTGPIAGAGRRAVRGPSGRRLSPGRPALRDAAAPSSGSAAVAFAVWVSPYTWAGESASIHVHIWAAIILGGLIVSLPLALIRWQPGAATTRHAVAIGQMLMSALIIHLMGGRIEAHFHVFGSLAFLALYRDPRVLITASAVVALDHFLRGYLLAALGLWHRHGQPLAMAGARRLGGLRGRRADPRLSPVAAGAASLATRQAEVESAARAGRRHVEDRTAELRESKARTGEHRGGGAGCDRDGRPGRPRSSSTRRRSGSSATAATRSSASPRTSLHPRRRALADGPTIAVGSVTWTRSAVRSLAQRIEVPAMRADGTRVSHRAGGLGHRRSRGPPVFSAYLRD